MHYILLCINPGCELELLFWVGGGVWPIARLMLEG